MYTCFVRNWYKWEMKGTFKKLVPNPRARRYVVMTFTGTNAEGDARAFCQKYNEEHKPGPLSRKCEYTSSF
jgi:hypothetical protein